MERGIVSMRVGFVLRSAEIKPLFRRFVYDLSFWVSFNIILKKKQKGRSHPLSPDWRSLQGGGIGSSIFFDQVPRHYRVVRER